MIKYLMSEPLIPLYLYNNNVCALEVQSFLDRNITEAWRLREYNPESPLASEEFEAVSVECYEYLTREIDKLVQKYSVGDPLVQTEESRVVDADPIVIVQCFCGDML